MSDEEDQGQTRLITGRFAINAEWVYDHSPLTHNAISVYGVMALYAGKTRGGIRPKVSTICRQARMSDAAVRRALKELVNSGLASMAAPRREDHGGWAPNSYALHDKDTDRDVLIERWDGIELGAYEPKVDHTNRGVGRTPKKAAKGGPIPRMGGVPSQVVEGSHPGDQTLPSQGPTISTSEQDQASRTSEQYQLASLATPDARATQQPSESASEPRRSAIRQIRRGVENTPAWADALAAVSDDSLAQQSTSDPDAMPTQWVADMAEDEDLAAVLTHYWAALVASGLKRYPDQFAQIEGALLVNVGNWGRTLTLGGIDWLFGESGSRWPHKVGGVETYLNNWARDRQRDDDSAARRRMRQSQSPAESLQEPKVSTGTQKAPAAVLSVLRAQEPTSHDTLADMAERITSWQPGRSA
jgi:hypothetical protein